MNFCKLFDNYTGRIKEKRERVWREREREREYHHKDFKELVTD